MQQIALFRSFFQFVIGVTLAFPLSAATIRVPQDQPTVTAGVAAAKEGDTVVLSPGIYYESNIWITKPITVTSVSPDTVIDSQHKGRCLIVTNTSAGTVLISGLTLSNGQIPYRSAGGAIFVLTGKCHVSGCIVQGVSGDSAYGGGPIANSGTLADVLVENSIVRNNFAANGCGISGCSVLRCLIYGNSAGNNPMALSACNATNCTVYSNTGGYLPNPWTAGGMSGGSAVNCIFWGNSGYNGQQVNVNGGSPPVTYSIVQDGYTGIGNLNAEPMFVNPAAGDLHLKAGSPATRSGDPTILNSDGSRSDMGAYGGDFSLSTCIPHRATASSVQMNGFVIGASIIDPGCGYTNTPLVWIVGGGGSGAQGMAIVNNGVLTAIQIINAGFGYSTTPEILIQPPFIPHPAIQITPMTLLSFTNLAQSGSYQLQRKAGWFWTNETTAFSATSTTYTQLVSGAANTASFRLVITPAPSQAFATAQTMNGFVIGTTLTTGGSGYVTPPKITISGGGGSNATAVATMSGGAVTGISITSAGIGYTNTPSIRIDPPPAFALYPTQISVMRLRFTELSPYDKYQLYLRPSLNLPWAPVGGLFTPSTPTTNVDIMVTNHVGFFRLAYTP